LGQRVTSPQRKHRRRVAGMKLVASRPLLMRTRGHCLGNKRARLQQIAISTALGCRRWCGRLLAAGALVLMPLPSARSETGEATFGEFDCLGNCSDHAAGFEWAREHKIIDSNDCPLDSSLSFREGCIVYTREPFRNSQQDDQGNDIVR
jgi:hypothetical protein